MNIYYIANGRMPTEKAHGIQIAKMCEAFLEEGATVTLVVPSRRGPRDSLRDFFQLRVDVPIIRLWAIDWYNGGRLGYFISSISFMISSALFVWKKKRTKERFILYTVDLDNYCFSFLTSLGTPVFSEMHATKPKTIATLSFFKKVQGIIAINSIIVDELRRTFPTSQARYLIEPNGVDPNMFSNLDKKHARTLLDLPAESPIIVYSGRFFGWKGLEIIPRAAALSPHIRWQIVGGDEAYFRTLVKESLPRNLCFAGSRPHKEIPLWLAAADAVLVLGTKRDIQSYRYTSPMKLFEYLAAGRPIVASNTPAIREVVSEKEVCFYEPDDAHDLAKMAACAVQNTPEYISRAKASRHLSTMFSWRARARRILNVMEEYAVAQ